MSSYLKTIEALADAIQRLADCELAAIKRGAHEQADAAHQAGLVMLAAQINFEAQ